MTTPAASASPSSFSSPPTRDEWLARPFCQNKLWSDVTPIKQDDGGADTIAVVPIAYPAHYSDVLDMFRGVQMLNEHSARALLLTEAVIECNSAHYTAWYYRRLCLAALKSDLYAELSWVETIAMDTPKNYQLWHHRRCLYEVLNDTSAEVCQRELKLTQAVLVKDAKNYHAWSHRQWCLKYFTGNLPKEVKSALSSSSAASSSSTGSAAAEHPNQHIILDELTYIDSLLETDVRNNSAWNQRYFIRTFGASQAISTAASSASSSSASSPAPSSTSTLSSGMSASIISTELHYIGSKLLLSSHNESAWNYAEGLMKQKEFQHHDELIELVKVIPEYTSPEESPEEEVTEAQCLARVQNRFAQALLVELYDSKREYKQAHDACVLLAESLDKLRVKYWMYRAQAMKKKSEQQK